MASQLVCVVVGIWLTAAPTVLGYGGPSGASDHIVGPAVGAIGLVASLEALRQLRFANLPFGFWLLVAPLVLEQPPAATLSHLAAALVLLTFAPGGRDVGSRSRRAREGGPGRSRPAAAGAPAGTTSEVVVITGASAGVGRATAIAFARRGARVALVARGAAGLQAAARDVESAGGSALVIQADAADAGAIDSVAERVERELGPIDVWVNNAMTSVFSPAHQMTAEEYLRVTQVTYLGYVHGTRAALERMRRRDRGVILQVGSALAYRGIPLQSAYCAAKHAVQGFCDSLRSELVHDKSRVRVTSVHLPALNTPQFGWVLSRLPRKAQPVPPIFQPEVAARAIVWAATHRRREVLVGWPTLLAVWGNRFFARLGDWYLGRTGYESQMTPASRDPDAPHNLWEPVDAEEDRGAHGDFDDRARGWGVGIWLTLSPGRIARLVGATAALVLLALAFLSA